MSEYASLRAEEIRAKLIELGVSEDEVATIKGKSALVSKLQEFDLDTIFDNLEPALVEPTITNEIELEGAPTPSMPEWTAYVLEQFTAKELQDGAPNVHGLRRVTEKLLGTIVESVVTVIETPNAENQGRATALHTLGIQTSKGFVTYSDAADAFSGNCLEPYSRHLVAMASTRAESRALRKALKINVTSAEEIVDNEQLPELDNSVSWNPNEKIPHTMILGIDAFCSKLNINVMEYINSGKAQYESIKDVPKAEGTKMFKYLNQYQTGKKEIPDHIQGYDANWREQ